MGVASPAAPETASSEALTPLRTDIGVAAAQNERDEMPRMSVEVTLVVAAVPFVDADREQPQIQKRAVRVGTVGVAQWFAPPELEWFDFGAG